VPPDHPNPDFTPPSLQGATLCNRRPGWDHNHHAVPPNGQLHNHFRCYFDAPSSVAEARILPPKHFRQELKAAQRGYEGLSEGVDAARRLGYAYADTLPKECQTRGGISMTRFNAAKSKDLEAQQAYAMENGNMPRPPSGLGRGPGVQKRPRKAPKRSLGRGPHMGPGYGHCTFHKHIKGMPLEGPFPHQNQGKTLYQNDVNDAYTHALRRL